MPTGGWIQAAKEIQTLIEGCLPGVGYKLPKKAPPLSLLLQDQVGVSECWRFYAVSTARVIFTAKTSFDVFSLSREQVWTFSSLG